MRCLRLKFFTIVLGKGKLFFLLLGWMMITLLPSSNLKPWDYSLACLTTCLFSFMWNVLTWPSNALWLTRALLLPWCLCCVGRVWVLSSCINPLPCWFPLMVDHFSPMGFFLLLRSNWEGRLSRSRLRWLMHPLTTISCWVGNGFTVCKPYILHYFALYDFHLMGRLLQFIKIHSIIRVSMHHWEILSWLSIILSRQLGVWA